MTPDQQGEAIRMLDIYGFSGAALSDGRVEVAEVLVGGTWSYERFSTPQEVVEWLRAQGAVGC
jgi:hypothetical protein